MRDDAVLRRALPLGRGLGRVTITEINLLIVTNFHTMLTLNCHLVIY